MVVIVKKKNSTSMQMGRMLSNSEPLLPPPGMDVTQSTCFMASTWKAMGYWALALGFLLFGALFLAVGMNIMGQKNAEWMLLMGLTSVFLGIAMAFRTWSARGKQGEPLLLLTPEGIIDHRSTGELVPWSAIESVGYIKWYGNYTPRLMLKPEEATALGLGATLQVPPHMLATGELDLLAALAVYHATYGTTIANTVERTLKSQI